MRSLLDDRKNLTPQKSMETLVKYARDQDNAEKIRRVRYLRASGMITVIGIGVLSGYIIKEFIFGYWTSFQPRNLISMQIETTPMKKRLIYTPQIYLKDTERINRDLFNKNLQTLKAQQTDAHHH